MTQTYHSERGGAALYIILGIALLAGLSYMVAKGFRFSDSSLSSDQTAMAAHEIIDYGTTLANAVQKLRLRACTDTQINFESAVLGTPNNPLAPSDDRCDIFGSVNGARMLPRQAQEFPDGHAVQFSGESSLLGVGTAGCGTSDCSDLYMTLTMKGPNAAAICTKINEILEQASLVPAPSTTYLQSTVAFAGTYGTHVTANPAFTGLNSACFNDSGDTTLYTFYQVLLAR